ncbi:MAG: alpha/beta hydrolase [Spirochaetaceae bacterium]|nr:alpha/beta hydrolase [Spirochaetaceae bacterium]
MHFGFSYIGLIYLVLLMVPNIIWAKNKPKDYEKFAVNESKKLLAFERIGEVLVSTFAVIFADFNCRAWTAWCLWLVASFVLMVLYEVYWVRYFKSEKRMCDQYRSLLGIPVAGASLPVAAFFLLGIYGCNILMIVAVIVLGIGHIGIHVAHEKEARAADVAGCASIAKPRKKRLVLRILKWVGIVLLILIFGAISFVIGVRNVRFIKHYANYINGVEEQTYIPLGGQEQYVLIIGRYVANPVIIYLHGGPGSPDTMAMNTFADELMDDYTFIGWDQRGCGRTFYKNEAADPQYKTVSFEQALLDLDELVDYACKRFDKREVILMGHSYGTILGSQYALSHPEKVSAYIAVAQLVSLSDGEILSYNDAMEKALAQGDDTSAMEKAYETYISKKGILNLLALRNQTSKYHTAKKGTNYVWQGLSSPYFGVDDAMWFAVQMNYIGDFMGVTYQLINSIMNYNAFEEKLEYQVPVYYISGSDDWTCPVDLVKNYMDEITAPEKSLTLIDGCGHSPHFGAPKEFADAVRKVLK